MRKSICLLLLACAGGADLTASGRAAIESPSDIPSTGPVPAGCERIEGAQIGQPGLQVLGGAVTFTAWRPKDGEPDEYVGFTVSTAGGVGYAVKSGGETVAGSAPTWVNPNATGGSEASGISNVTVCTLDPGDPGESGGSGGMLDEGSPCTQNSECMSQRCTGGICIPVID